MAEIYLARILDRDAGRQSVVIKRLLPHMADDPQFNAMFIDEARLSKRLNHPNIVKTYEFGWHSNELFIAMEFVDGLDTLAILRECAHRKVRMPTEVAVYIIQQVLLALDHAHNQVDESGQRLGVVHRDISPSNILLSRRGEVKLVDFGIARAAQQSHKTRDGTLKGKYGYMSPEQVVDTEVDARSDIFSVGIVLAELLTGRRLFAATNELEVLLMVRDAKLDRLDRYGTHIGMDLDRILRKALNRRVDERFATARELSDVLAEWMEMKGHRVTPLAIAQIIESLYSDAWKRKRASMAGGEARAPAAADRSDPAAQSAVASAGAAIPARRSGIPRFVNDELSEPSEIDGIPSGKLGVPDSVPVVSIEQSDGIIAHEMENVETNRLPGFDRPVARLTSVARPIVRPGTEDEETIQRDFAAPAHAMHPVLPATSATLETRPATAERSARSSERSEAPKRAPGPREASLTRARPSQPGEADREYSSVDAAIDALGTHPGRGLDEDDDDVDTAVHGEKIVMETLADSGHDFDGSEVSSEASRDDVQDALSGGDAPLARAETPVPSYPDDAGDFAESPPIAVFYRLAVSRATGLLITRVGGVCKHIYFRNGIPEYISSNVATELFGEYLVQSGALMPGELSMALAVMPRHGGKLGDTLVALGLLRPLDVFRHLTRQVRSKMVDVCTWFKGRFEWYGGQEHQRDAFPLDLNPFEVIGAGAMMLPLDRVEEWMRTVATKRPFLSPDARTSPELFQLGESMRRLCNELDGERTVVELRARFRVPSEAARFLRSLFLLVHTELVTLV